MEPVGFEPTSIVIFITMSNPEGPKNYSFYHLHCTTFSIYKKSVR